MEDLTGFIKQFMNPTASYLVPRRAQQSGGTKYKVFIGRKVGKGAVKKITFRPEHHLLGEKARFFYHADCFFFLLKRWNGEGPCGRLSH